MRKMWIQSVEGIFPQIYIFYFYLRKKGKQNVDIMCGNKWITVNQKAYVPHYHILLQLKTCAMSSVNHMTHKIASGKC